MAELDSSFKVYLDAIASIPLPTKEQTGRFGGHVASAHSWYKHLPPSPPGERFIFFINPNVSRLPVYKKGFFGEKLKGFRDLDQYDHTIKMTYDISLPTQKYHEYYGFWAYSVMRKYPTGQDPELPTIMNIKNQRISIPTQLIDIGSCYLTSWLHECQPLAYDPRISTISKSDEEYLQQNPGDPSCLRFIEYRKTIDRYGQLWKEMLQLKSFEDKEAFCNLPEYVDVKNIIQKYVEEEYHEQCKKMMHAIYGVLKALRELRGEQVH